MTLRDLNSVEVSDIFKDTGNNSEKYRAPSYK